VYSQLAVMPGSARATAAQLHYSGNLTIKARVNIRSTDKLEQSQKRICLEYQDNTDVLTALLSSCSPKEQQIMQSSQAKQTSRFFYIALFFHLTVASQFCSKLFFATIQDYSRHRPHQGRDSQPFGASLPLCLLALCLLLRQAGLHGGHGPSRGGVHITHL